MSSAQQGSSEPPRRQPVSARLPRCTVTEVRGEGGAADVRGREDVKEEGGKARILTRRFIQRMNFPFLNAEFKTSSRSETGQSMVLK